MPQEGDDSESTSGVLLGSLSFFVTLRFFFTVSVPFVAAAVARFRRGAGELFASSISAEAAVSLIALGAMTLELIVVEKAGLEKETKLFGRCNEYVNADELRTTGNAKQ